MSGPDPNDRQQKSYPVAGIESYVWVYVKGKAGKSERRRLATGCFNTLKHPLFNFPFKPAGATPEFDGFGELVKADEFVEPLIRHAGESRNRFHIDTAVVQQVNVIDGSGRVFRLTGHG
jgi:hypothetical protein